MVNVGDYVAAINVDDFPSGVLEKAKICILDICGSMISAHETKSANKVRTVIKGMGGNPESTLLGTGVKSSAPFASWANSSLASALDCDDGVLWEKGHAGHHGAMVVPACLCMAEKMDLSGKKFIEAIVTGYEIGILAGHKMSSIEYDQAGPMGCYGVAAAVAKLMSLDADSITNALRVADEHNPVGGIHLFTNFKNSSRDIPMVKEKIGWSTFSGIIAAYMSKEGFTGSSSIFDDITEDLLNANGGNRFRILDVYHKPYCSCRLTHSVLDGILQLASKNELLPDDVKEVIVETSSFAANLDIKQPKSIEDMQFSIPYTVGFALVDNAVGPSQINENKVDDSYILDQALKVRLVVNPNIDKLGVSGALNAVVRIIKIDDTEYQASITNPRWNAANPVTYDEIKEKFRLYSGKFLGEIKIEKVIHCIEQLEELTTVRELIEPLTYFGN